MVEHYKPAASLTAALLVRKGTAAPSNSAPGAAAQAHTRSYLDPVDATVRSYLPVAASKHVFERAIAASPSAPQATLARLQPALAPPPPPPPPPPETFGDGGFAWRLLRRALTKGAGGTGEVAVATRPSKTNAPRPDHSRPQASVRVRVPVRLDLDRYLRLKAACEVGQSSAQSLLVRLIDDFLAGKDFANPVLNAVLARLHQAYVTRKDRS